MKNKTLHIKLLSDLCPASGDGFAGFVDTDICYEDNGQPYIPGKRIKGCLRECGLDILSVESKNKEYEEAFNRLFGKIGEESPGEMTIGNGRLRVYSKTETYTSTRTRTRMENGMAYPGSLRTFRVINKGAEFEFPVTLSEEFEDFFSKCVKSFRAMGLNRSRGLGEIKCTLIEGSLPETVNFTTTSERNETSFSYKLTLIEPLISADRSGKPHNCEDYIFGSAILGAFAGMYIKKFKKYNLDTNKAHYNKDFRHIFLEGGVKFTAAMPYVNRNVHYPAPNSLKTNKIQNRLVDDSSDNIVDDKSEKNPICKKLGGFVSVDDSGLVKKIIPAKSVFLHHARPHDKSIGQATSDAGEFYSYEALSEGQEYIGKIIGRKEDIEALMSLFDDSNVFWIGRSRTAQYGKVCISSYEEPSTQGNLILKSGDKFRIVIVTPMILEDKHGINTTNLSLIESAFGTEYTIIRSNCTETTIAGYNAKWRLPKAQQRAVAEGSVIIFQYNGNGTEIRSGFMGVRNGEGFGQYRVESVPKVDAFELDTSSPEKEDVEERNKKDEAYMGAEYGDKIEDPPVNSILQRVIAASKICNDFDKLANKLCDIKQPEQQRAALSFVCEQKDMYFKTDPERLSEKHISELMKNKAKYLFPNKRGKTESYEAYKKYLTAAAVRIKQKRRFERGAK